MSVNRGTTSTEKVKDGKCKMWIKGRERIINLHVLFPRFFLFCLSWFKPCLHLAQEKMDRETIKACLLGNGSYVLHQPLTSPRLPWKRTMRGSAFASVSGMSHQANQMLPRVLRAKSKSQWWDEIRTAEIRTLQLELLTNNFELFAEAFVHLLVHFSRLSFIF